MTFRLLNLAVILATCGACSLGADHGAHSGGDAGTSDGGADAGVDLASQLVLLSDPELVLSYGSTSIVKVMLLHETWPAAGAEVQFTMHGRANDSSLSHLTTLTDEAGMASVEVVAGLVESTFSVRVGAEGAEPIYVPVTVSSSDLASLTVKPAGEPEAYVTRHRAQLYGAEACDSARVAARDFDRTSIVWEGSAQAEFRHLPIGASFAVLLEALDAEGNVVALRCVDGVTVAADGTTVEIDLGAHEVKPEGDYDATLRLELGDAASEWADRFEGAHELASDAEALLDALEAHLTLSGDTEGLAAIAAARDTLLEGLGGWLAGRGPVAAIGALAQTLDSASALESQGVLSVSSGSLSFVETARVLASVDGSRHTVPSAPWTVAGTFVSPVRAPVELGTELLPSALASALFAAVAPNGDLDAWLAELGGCGELASFTALLSLGTSCDEACLVGVCGALLTDLLADSLESLDEGLTSGAVSVEGALVFVEPDLLSLEATRVTDAGLSADLPGASASSPATLEGELALP